jgi:hypothetical protein
LARGNQSPFFGGKGGAPLRPETESAPPDYDFPLEEPSAKELAALLRGDNDNFVITLKAVPEPVIDIFLDQLPAFKGKDDANFVFMIPRGQKYRYYCVPFKWVVPMLKWVKLSTEKRPRWQLHLVPSRHRLVGRNGNRVENIDLTPYYNTF